MTLADTVGVVQRITSLVDVPVSADLEAGYAPTAEGVAQSARTAVLAGAVGINLHAPAGHRNARQRRQIDLR